MKVVINKCFGGFGLSLKAQQAYADRKGLTLYFYKQTKYKHRDRAAEYHKVSVDEGTAWAHAHTTDHGEVFDGKCGSDDCYYYPDIPRDDPDLIAVIEEQQDAANGEYDCLEHIAEAHRTWY